LSFAQFCSRDVSRILWLVLCLKHADASQWCASDNCFSFSAHLWNLGTFPIHSARSMLCAPLLYLSLLFANLISTHAPILFATFFMSTNVCLNEKNPFCIANYQFFSLHMISNKPNKLLFYLLLTFSTLGAISWPRFKLCVFYP